MEIPKLTTEQIQELDTYAAQKILAQNVNLLAEIGVALFVASRELGEAQIKVTQLKHYKDVIIEQNRALKAVVQSG